MAEYTYKDIIIDPTSEEAKNAIGKKCYMYDSPTMLLKMANSDDGARTLESIDESDYPFNDKEFGSEWTCIIVKKEPCYEDQVKQWIEENNLKVGDYVKVTRRAENHADGLDDYWYDLMRDSVGKILKVKEISNFIMLDNGINYPYFVLEKVEEPKPEYVPFEAGNEFLAAYCNNETEKLYTIYRDLASHGIWLKAKYADDALFMVTEIWSYGVVFSCDMKTTEELDDEYLTITEPTTWEQLLMLYTFLDGSPCGKKVEYE